MKEDLKVLGVCGGQGEWKRLEAARKIDENCANLAFHEIQTSFGSFHPLIDIHKADN